MTIKGSRYAHQGVTVGPVRVVLSLFLKLVVNHCHWWSGLWGLSGAPGAAPRRLLPLAGTIQPDEWAFFD